MSVSIYLGSVYILLFFWIDKEDYYISSFFSHCVVFLCDVYTLLHLILLDRDGMKPPLGL